MREDTLARWAPKVPKDKQEAEENWESEETLAQVDEITAALDRKENPVMLDQRERPGRMERKEAPGNSEEGEQMAEEANLDRQEIPESQALMVFREKLVLEDQEANQDQTVHQDPEEKMETLDPEVPEAVQVKLEIREEEELLVARVSPEIQDLRGASDLLVLVESLETMAEMGLASRGLTGERAMRASQDSQD